MTYAEISKSVSKIKKKYGETDPFLLCEAMGIRVLFQNMGSHESAVKGFFLESNRIRVITINSELPKIVQRIIAAHELCHAINHRKTESTPSTSLRFLTKTRSLSGTQTSLPPSFCWRMRRF